MRRSKRTTLKSGRPPLVSSSSLASRSGNHPSKPSSLSTVKLPSRATRTIIRAHHNLHKSRAKAAAEGNHELVTSIDAEIEKLGGLEVYQAASLRGQSRERGGDSSIILVRWLEEAAFVGKTRQRNGKDLEGTTDTTNDRHTREGLRILEVGALSSKNAISKMIGKGVGSVRRIDLKSQEPGIIEEVDFMDLPQPKVNEDKYDVLSLSLVLNYVPDPKQRGEMLRRTTLFLHDHGLQVSRKDDQTSSPKPEDGIMPCLFLVLPLPCVTHSRYMSTAHLQTIMKSLGYESVRMHQSAKLHYELYRYTRGKETRQVFKKTEVNPGRERNNFCIILEDG